jgi:hypothetical protein
VFARFHLGDEHIADVLANTQSGEKYEPTWTVDIVDGEEQAVASVAKTLYIRCKRPSDKLAD